MKIKELAKQIGLPPRRLLERCKAEGLPVQNSITRLSPEQVRQVRAWFSERETTGRSEQRSSG